jgi:hypothetical protein
MGFGLLLDRSKEEAVDAKCVEKRMWEKELSFFQSRHCRVEKNLGYLPVYSLLRKKNLFSQLAGGG